MLVGLICHFHKSRFCSVQPDENTNYWSPFGYLVRSAHNAIHLQESTYHLETMKFQSTLLLLIPSFAKGYETISKSLSFPPPTPLNNTSRGYCSAEEDSNQCTLDDGAVVLSSSGMESREPPKSFQADYS